MHNRKRLGKGISAVAFGLGLIFSSVLPVVAFPESISSEINSSVMSPYCPGVTLSACTSDEARKLRDEIGAWAESGLNRQEITSRLVDRFGQQVLGVPRWRGWGTFGWLMPLVALLVGLAMVFAILRSMIVRRERRIGIVDAQSEMSELDRQIEEELRRRMG